MEAAIASQRDQHYQMFKNVPRRSFIWFQFEITVAIELDLASEEHVFV